MKEGYGPFFVKLPICCFGSICINLHWHVLTTSLYVSLFLFPPSRYSNTCDYMPLCPSSHEYMQYKLYSYWRSYEEYSSLYLNGFCKILNIHSLF